MRRTGSFSLCPSFLRRSMLGRSKRGRSTGSVGSPRRLGPPPEPRAFSRSSATSGTWRVSTSSWSIAGRPEGPSDCQKLAADVVRAKVDVILAAGIVATVPAVRATRTIPIVFVAGFPVEWGIVSSLARPGANVTGVAIQVGLAKHLQLLAEMAPRISRVAYLVTPMRCGDQSTTGADGVTFVGGSDQRPASYWRDASRTAARSSAPSTGFVKYIPKPAARAWAPLDPLGNRAMSGTIRPRWTWRDRS
jgi:ABC transporter substrate binding protein